ncbi:MAG: hypothetical protein WC964_03905 [Acholeplasmataceae bacterium]
MSLITPIMLIEFNLSVLLSFLFGISVGFLLLLLVYLYAVLKSLNKNLKLRGVDEEDIDEEEIKWLIKDGQELFKNRKQRSQIGFFKHLLDICRDLSVDIAKKFYPKSKYPYLELTVDESIHLSHYITNRVDELLSSKILKLFRGLTIRRIVEMNEVKTNIEKTAVVKTVKKLKINKVLKHTMAVVNVFNPVYWFRRLTKEVALDIVMVKIGLAVIAITGEETYKIYSKKVFKQDKTLDFDVEDIYEELTKEFEEASKNEAKK